jgi:anaerobic C4-dicarboxylate transporter
MIKTVTVLASAIVALVSTSFVTSSNAQDLAKDQAYCRKLVDTFVGNNNYAESLDLSVAINQCRSGKPEQAIPVLQERLRDAGYDVPPRS